MNKIDNLKVLAKLVTGEDIDGDTTSEILEKINKNYSNTTKTIVSSDQSKPMVLRNFESGVYVLQGVFKPNEGATQQVFAQSPLYASIVKTDNITYAQLFYAVNNSVQYLEITDDAFTLDTVSLKQNILKTNNKTIIGAINELYDMVSV